MRCKQKLKIAAAVAALAAACTVDANAVAVLKLSDGTTTQTVTDSDGDGVIVYNSSVSGPIGGWLVSITTGLTKPAIGNSSRPEMDVNSVSVSSAGAGTLTITFKDYAFAFTGVTPVTPVLHMGGTTSGTVTYSAKVGLDVSPSTAWATSPLLTATGPAFSATGWIQPSFNLPASFDMEQVITFTHTGAGTSSGDFALAVPEPSTYFAGAMLLLPFAASTIRFIRKNRAA